MIVGNKTFLGGTFIMAIVNLTPDSLYEGSRAMGDDALFAVEKAVREGADIVDLGPQSTRPGHVTVSAEEEQRRLEPLRKIKERFDIPISVDTFYASTARLALQAGADMINDVKGLADPNMAKVIAEHDASVCIMHNSANQVGSDLFGEVIGFLRNAVDVAVGSGIDKNKICVDGGIGFAKTKEQNLELLYGYDKLSSLGYPTLLGCSRKSLFGGNVSERLAPTLAATELAAKKGVLFVRVHDVKENVAVIDRLKERGDI